jgi:cytochrome P450 family 628
MRHEVLKMTGFPILIPVLSALSGVLAHLLIWQHGERDPFSGYIFLYEFLTPSASLIILQYSLGLTLLSACSAALYLETSHLLGTFAGIVLYRISFHQLHRFPGPLGGKIWIWDTFARTSHSHHQQSIVIDEIYAKYGPVVRYAPDRLSINSAASISLIHGAGSTWQ